MYPFLFKCLKYFVNMIATIMYVEYEEKSSS